MMRIRFYVIRSQNKFFAKYRFYCLKLYLCAYIQLLRSTESSLHLSRCLKFKMTSQKWKQLPLRRDQELSCKIVNIQVLAYVINHLARLSSTRATIHKTFLIMSRESIMRGMRLVACVKQNRSKSRVDFDLRLQNWLDGKVDKMM